MKKPLPIGVDSFRDMIAKGYYYVDKTLMIKEILDKQGEVNLFTRPRRFGKTLNISMLQYFFEDTRNEEENEADRRLFEGLGIMRSGERYTDRMCRYPVITLSLKSGKQPDFESAYASLKDEIQKQFIHFAWIMEEENLTQVEKNKFSELMQGTAPRFAYAKSLQFLSQCLAKVYGTNTIILIDEYDVPLENSYFCGFYGDMADFIRSLFESALKSNRCLEFAVITGCLRITKESIFTGLNNLKINTILSAEYDEFFGFTQDEVEGMLDYYGMRDCAGTLKTWYDGYLFGEKEVYNPWSVINYVSQLCASKDALPSPFWANTSSNSIVRSLVERADIGVKGELESLIEGNTITKQIHEDITYEDVYESEDNLWNFLFFTGYLKQITRKMESENIYVEMAIPNAEVRYIYKNTILNWFEKRLKGTDFRDLYSAMEQGNTPVMEKVIAAQLLETISFYDYAESYYHGFLAGLLKNNGKYRILSNREAGTGRPDIILKTPSVKGRAILFELKIAGSYAQMEKQCENAALQMREQQYDAQLKEEGYSDILMYAVCFYRKECMIRKV